MSERVLSMEAQNHILQELKDLGSSLPHLPHPYRVADGYFAGLPEQILLRIKAEGQDAAAETAELSPVVAGISRSMPYHVPAGYFESLDLSWVWASDVSPSEELKNISSLLGDLKKDLPFTVPDGYFEKEVVIASEEKPARPARVVTMNPRRWFKYAAAACVIGLVATVFFMINGKNAIDPNEKSYAWVEKEPEKSGD
ncbi:MAG: hypothetical protein NVV59_15885 [Chitinophagaceae bacterium]|nr:hypothetical protein [Chitinophagaceae bacterium]